MKKNSCFKYLQIWRPYDLFPLTILQQLSQLGRSTTTDPTDPIEHFSQEKSLLKIIAKIFSYSLTTLHNVSQVATRTKAATQQPLLVTAAAVAVAADAVIS